MDQTVGRNPGVVQMTDLDKEIIMAMADCNMNESEVSRKLFMHRNTVVYHINRVKKLTGLDSTNFYDLHKLVTMVKGVPDQTMTALEKMGRMVHGGDR